MQIAANQIKNKWIVFFRIMLSFALILLTLAGAIQPTLAQGEEPPEEARPQNELAVNTASAGIATGNPNGPHSTYAWPFTVVQMGHAIQSYQNYSGGTSSAYFHHGIDMIAPNGTDVFTRSGGRVVNVENYQPGNDLYWEVAILDDEGYVWQYHHIDRNTIPQAIHNAYAAWQANHNNGYVAPNTYIGDIVYWTVTSFGYRFNHIHLNILAAGDAYLNTMEFHTPLSDTQKPEIQQIGLYRGTALIPGNVISGDYGLYVRARDLFLSDVYYLPPYKVEFSLDGGPLTTVWDFKNLPGGASDTAFVNDFFVAPPTDGDYSIRDFIIDLGFTTGGQRAFPSTHGLHQITVTVWDYNGNSDTKTYYWTVYSTYENASAAAIPDNSCASGGLTRNFNVTDTGLVTDVNIGLNIAHTTRGQIQVSLQAPGDTTPTIIVSTASDSNDNYDLLLDDSSTNIINDNNVDTTAAPDYESDRIAGPGSDLSLDSFNGKSAQGTWTLTVCDGTNGTTGTLNKAKLAISTRPVTGTAIGNRVWLDENSNGLTEAGEPGIPNARVELCTTGACSTILRTTYTDSLGGYIFRDQAGANLNAGTYYVRVTPPAGLTQTYDKDATMDSVTSATLAAGQQELTLDFGYNWNHTSSQGVIGDKLWVDANADGRQQNNEIGLTGITVQLITEGADHLFGTGDDQVLSTAVTDQNGNFRFTGLAAGAYVVRVPTLPSGYTQTGDPDQVGGACTTCDSQTTRPILLSPGDVFLMADFGFQPVTAPNGSIGGTLWVDSDRANDLDAAEPRLGGVSVALILDSDSDLTWDAGEPVIATALTDSSGQYLFSGLPADLAEDYLVWVNDTGNVLGELFPAFDLGDGAFQANPAAGVVTGLRISAVANLTSTPVNNLHFAFVAGKQDTIGGATAVATTLDGMIGNTVWLDTNGNGSLDSAEGLEGVTVNLFASGGANLLESTRTDERGQYYFGGLSPSSTYVVQVLTATLPYAGLTNFVDPDAGTASSSTVTLATGSPVNLNQDFGYRDASSPNSISGTIWRDRNADGTLQAGETERFDGITVALKTTTNRLVATTSTTGGGNFTFGNLPDGTYHLSVTDDAHLLSGYWKSTGASAGSDNNSQVDPYVVTVISGATNITADFGYFANSASLGNWIWDDTDSDGIQDAGETGFDNLLVTLTIAYPNGNNVVFTTRTVNGQYRFDNLLADEHFNGIGTPGVDEPTLTLSVAIPTDYVASPANATTDDLDSDGVAVGNNLVVSIGTPNSLLIKGDQNNLYDMGLALSPTAVTGIMGPFGSPGRQIRISWNTVNEQKIAGFRLYRGETPENMIHHADARFAGALAGGSYEFVDRDVQPGETYTYWLEVIDSNAVLWLLEPAIVKSLYINYIPSVTY